ncbi:YggS family pyridoxal phosphate-dependent enzyme [Candidatus Venteria ishoeyi]|uniref:YggS family pyridoxal phosphate-dependent enzyme n=1 Tax=Candidatus Venteria ishoeyi TaxID=1899563 RepID=UPI0025A4EB68|nr:YggS family pyridoxal phosphate-dependent enzyme [Candidatus Venteria ishoeyi]MDM8547302.1 YggS family pyridoxal phosphate-dependent enzyme [Candidatus Venteria ishoeyi]
MNNIAQRLQQVRERITQTATKWQRNPADIQLLAVSKTHPATAIKSAATQGQRCFGENYLQDALPKIESLKNAGYDLEWHFIGAMQSNKTRPIAAHFDWVETLSSLKHAQRLHQQRPPHLAPLNVCLQVNISREPQKSGINPAELETLASAVSQLPRLRLRGLMALPASADTLEQQRLPFARLFHLFTELKSQGFALDTLSMGMSADLEAAIAEGATQVRIGTAIFGPRIKK